MDEGSPSAAPAGWYPTPGGGQRYWDGQAWLALALPPDVEQRAAPGSTAGARPRRRTVLLASVVLVGVIAASLAGYSLKSAHDEQRSAAAASQQAKAQQDQAARDKAAADAAYADHAAVEAEKQRKALEAKQEKADEDKAERKLRKASVHEIEASVKKMAKKHVKTGLIDGPIVRVSCDPVSGGSVDDLTEKTTVFQCFAANKTNKDGSAEGYYYNATMNWSTGSYTYGYGKP